MQCPRGPAATRSWIPPRATTRTMATGKMVVAHRNCNSNTLINIKYRENRFIVKSSRGELASCRCPRRRLRYRRREIAARGGVAVGGARRHDVLVHLLRPAQSIGRRLNVEDQRLDQHVDAGHQGCDSEKNRAGRRAVLSECVDGGKDPPTEAEEHQREAGKEQ